jgi:hypothetical protein
MATTYITKSRREDLIEQYLDCWWETHSYSTEEQSETEAFWVRNQLEAMNNSELVSYVTESGWGIK